MDGLTVLKNARAKLLTLCLVGVTSIPLVFAADAKAAIEGQVDARKDSAPIAVGDEAPETWRERLHVDAMASWGLANTALALNNGGTTVSQMGLGVTAGWKIDPGVWVGLSTDYRSAGLSADLLSTVSEVEGTRWNYASPAVGMAWGDSWIKAEVILSGAYRFARANGSDAFTLGAPRGLRMTFLHPMVERFHAGIQGEVTSWGEKQTAAGVERLLQREVLWQASLTAAWVF